MTIPPCYLSDQTFFSVDSIHSIGTLLENSNFDELNGARKTVLARQLAYPGTVEVAAMEARLKFGYYLWLQIRPWFIPPPANPVPVRSAFQRMDCRCLHPNRPVCSRCPWRFQARPGLHFFHHWDRLLVVG